MKTIALLTFIAVYALLLLLPLSLQILPLPLLSQLVCFRRRMHIN